MTALALHADIAHVLSNAVAGRLLFTEVASLEGVGIGGALVLLAGAVGLLGSVGMTRRRRNAFSRSRAWLPIAGAFALLGMLGRSGRRVDIWAHFFGLLVRAVLRLLVGLVSRRPPKLRIQWVRGTAAVAVIIYCWTVAFH